MSGSDPIFNFSPSEDPFDSNGTPEDARRPEVNNALNRSLFPTHSSTLFRGAEERRSQELLACYREFLANHGYSPYQEMGSEWQRLSREFVKHVHRVMYRDLRKAGLSDPAVDLAIESCAVKRLDQDIDLFIVQGFLADEYESPVLVGYDSGLERTKASMSVMLIGSLSIDGSITAIPQLSVGATQELMQREQPSWVWAPAIRDAIRQKIDALIQRKAIKPSRIENLTVDRLFEQDRVEISGSRVEVLIGHNIYDFILGTDHYGTPQCAEVSP